MLEVLLLIVRRFVIPLLVIYGIFLALLFFFSDRFVFFKGDQSTRRYPNPRKSNLNYKHYALPFTTSDNVELDSLLLVKDTKLPTVFFCHGNAGCIRDRIEFAELLLRKFPVNVYLLEYRGYGDSEKVRPTESGLITDAIDGMSNLIMTARDGLFIENPQFILFGRSLGAAVVIGSLEVMLRSRPDLLREMLGVVVENTFTSIRKVASRMTHIPKALFPNFAIRNNFNNQKRLKKIVKLMRKKGYAFHMNFISGRKEDLLYEDMMDTLIDIFPDGSKKNVMKIANGAHNDTWKQREYAEGLAVWFEKVLGDKKKLE